MQWHEALTGEAFRKWLTKLTEKAHVPAGTRLDPYATSLRRSGFIASKLGKIERGEALDGDASQAITDLVQIGVILKEPDGVILTELGRTVLAQWSELGLDNEDDDHEIARCVILVHAALDLRLETYISMAGFWREIRQLYLVDDLLTKPHGLYLLSYINQELEGFNPWTMIRAARSNVPSATELDWGGLLKALSHPDTTQAIEALSKRVNDFGNRSAGRVSFCRAMELCTLSNPESKQHIQAWRDAGQISERAHDSAVRALERIMQLPESDPQWAWVEALLMDRQNVVLYGPPGTGKTRAGLGIANRWEHRFGSGTVFKTTFHPSYSYEDFIQGFRPDPNNPNTYRLVDGAFLLACKKAKELAARSAATKEETPQVLILIDEINRGDTARIFGELITFIEADKRGIQFRLAQDPENEFSVPKNLFLLGTMNTADRSVSLMDVALRRRFAFVSFPPEADKLGADSGWLGAVDDISLPKLLRVINSRLEAEGIDQERSIGHALLSIPADSKNSKHELRRRLEVDIVPLVMEYCSLDRPGTYRVLGNIVNEKGFPRQLTDTEFFAALKALLA